ncbi:gamma-glutamyl-gamma-aminobutyrate hydrolase family protein [Telmatobacter bradus]|uniref:gamma-glutamyl-gamma-aminobutyrate hydrolase family protein n=1 Tax=Telmatobacter bradus TaxID=474953 RepID=UPI003B42F90E
MNLRILLPVPTAEDAAYNQRTLPAYCDALSSVGLEPVTIPLDTSPAERQKLTASCHGVLLPGSRFDVDPARYGEARIPACGPSDPVRTLVDEALLTEAFSHKKPVLTICHGTQSLNAWRVGKLTQDLQTAVNHQPGRTVVEAHAVEVAANSRLSGMLEEGIGPLIQVNSTHHQAIRVPGEGLRVAAISPVDGVIEAVELPAEDHFVVAVQWHPERTLQESAFSRAIFLAFKAAAEEFAKAAEESK